MGIHFGIMRFLCGLYLLATESVSAERPNGKLLIFREGQELEFKPTNDEEAPQTHKPRQLYPTIDQEDGQSTEWLNDTRDHAATFLWDNLSYEIEVKGGFRQLLDDVEGWIQPGSQNALMGTSKAGKKWQIL